LPTLASNSQFLLLQPPECWDFKHSHHSSVFVVMAFNWLHEAHPPHQGLSFKEKWLYVLITSRKYLSVPWRLVGNQIFWVPQPRQVDT
jgi:hypothetical protein